MIDPSRQATRRRFLSLAAVSAPLVAGCTEASSETAVQAETDTPVGDERSRRDAVQCYTEGVGYDKEGKSLLFEGNAALEDGNYRAAADAFERAGSTFGDALGEFERAYEIVSWLDLEDGDDEWATTILEDAGRRAGHHEAAAADLRAAAVHRDDGADAADGRLESAREELDAATEYPLRDPDRLASALSVEEE